MTKSKREMKFGLFLLMFKKNGVRVVPIERHLTSIKVCKINVQCLSVSWMWICVYKNLFATFHLTLSLYVSFLRLIHMALKSDQNQILYIWHIPFEFFCLFIFNWYILLDVLIRFPLKFTQWMCLPAARAVPAVQCKFLFLCVMCACVVFSIHLFAYFSWINAR